MKKNSLSTKILSISIAAALLVGIGNIGIAHSQAPQPLQASVNLTFCGLAIVGGDLAFGAQLENQPSAIKTVTISSATGVSLLPVGIDSTDWDITFPAAGPIHMSAGVMTADAPGGPPAPGQTLTTTPAFLTDLDPTTDQGIDFVLTPVVQNKPVNQQLLAEVTFTGGTCGTAGAGFP